jgi:hypothetical protein
MEVIANVNMDALLNKSLRERLENAQQTKKLKGVDGVFATFFFIANSARQDAIYSITADGALRNPTLITGDTYFKPMNEVYRYNVYNNNTNKSVATLVLDATTCDLVCITDKHIKYIMNLLTATHDDIATLCETVETLI